MTLLKFSHLGYYTNTVPKCSHLISTYFVFLVRGNCLSNDICKMNKQWAVWEFRYQAVMAVMFQAGDPQGQQCSAAGASILQMRVSAQCPWSMIGVTWCSRGQWHILIQMLLSQVRDKLLQHVAIVGVSILIIESVLE